MNFPKNIVLFQDLCVEGLQKMDILMIRENMISLTLRQLWRMFSQHYLFVIIRSDVRIILFPSRSISRICKNDVILARFGELHPAVLDKWNIKRIVYGFTISLPDIMILQELRLTIKNSKISFCGKRSCGPCTGTVIK